METREVVRRTAQCGVHRFDMHAAGDPPAIYVNTTSAVHERIVGPCSPEPARWIQMLYKYIRTLEALMRCYKDLR